MAPVCVVDLTSSDCGPGGDGSTAAAAAAVTVAAVPAAASGTCASQAAGDGEGDGDGGSWWTCPVCTFHNLNMLGLICEVCQSTRTGTGAIRPSSPRQNDGMQHAEGNMELPAPTPVNADGALGTNGKNCDDGGGGGPVWANVIGLAEDQRW